MGIETEKYIRKPLYVDAIRVTEENFDELVSWCHGTMEVEGQKKYIRVRVNTPKIPRQTKAFVGDWLLWTERSGFKVYTHRAFKLAFDPVEESASEEPEQQTRVLQDVHVHSVGPVVAEPSAESGVGEITEEIEVVPATPEAIADVVNAQQPMVEDSPTAPPPVHGSKRVLSEDEQREMDPEEVQELIRSGEVILAQDLAA
jgi:hypothetical protein